MTESPVAVIDIGSNSGRVVVVRTDARGGIDVLEELRAPLRLVRGLEASGHLQPEAMAHTLQVLADFRAVAMAAGATRFIAVATAAVREARNGADLVAQARSQLGIDVAVIDGGREAQLAFTGAILGLPVEHGMLVDLGGGSMQVVRFRDRRLQQSWSLPLGALRLSDRFLRTDPPSASELRQVAAHVEAALAAAGLPRLAADEVLVGTGGTIRNLARVDRRLRRYPVARVHGHEIPIAAVREVATLVAKHKASRRARIPGLSEERVDSIVGGAVVVQTLLDHVGATRIVVAGKGLREGLAQETVGPILPASVDVRRASLATLTQRFASWSAHRAERRRALATAVLTAVAPQATTEEHETLDYAAHLLDVGRSVDYYRRHEHTAAILAAADLAGFTHRAIALLVTTLRAMDLKKVRLKPYRPLLAAGDEPMVARLASILALAEETERRSPPGPAAIECELHGDEFICRVPLATTPELGALWRRFRRTTGYHLRLELAPPGVPPRAAPPRNRELLDASPGVEAPGVTSPDVERRTP